VRLPRAEADPAELGTAVRVLANHVVAAAVFLDGDLRNTRTNHNMYHHEDVLS
jgi:hypothetical protein